MPHRYLLPFLALLAFACSKTQPTPDAVSDPPAIARADSLIDAMQFDSARLVLQNLEPQYRARQEWTLYIACRRKMAHCLWAGHEGEKATALCREALAEAGEKLDSAHPEVAQLYTVLGNVEADKRTEAGFRQSVANFTWALDLTRQHYGDPHPALAGAYERLGIAHWLVDDYAGAIPYYEKALSYLGPVSPANGRVYAKIYNNLGLAYYTMGLYREALEAFAVARDVVVRISGARDARIVKYLVNMAEARLELAEPGDAQALLQEALAIQTLHGAPQSKIEAYLLAGMGNTYMSLENYPEAIAYFRRYLCFWRPGHPDDVSGLTDALQKLGNALLRQEPGEVGLGYLHQAHRLTENTYGSTSYNRVGPLASLGRAYRLMLQPFKAVFYFNEALQIARRTLGEHHPEIAALQQELAELYLAAGDIATAERFATNARRALLMADAVAVDRPGISQINSLNQFVATLTLLGRIRCARPESRTPPAALRSSIDYFQLAMAYTDSLKLTLVTGTARQELQKQASQLAEQALQALYARWQRDHDPQDLQTAFFFLEKSKAADLLAGLHDAGAKQAARIPKALLEREQFLKAQLTYYQNQSFQPADKMVFSAASWQERYADTRRQLAALVSDLENQYPDYYRLKYDLRVATLDEVKKIAAARQARVIEYFYGEQAIYAFAIGADSVRWLRLDNRMAIQTALDTIGRCLLEAQPEWKNDAQKKVAFDTYCRQAGQLYRDLLQPVLAADTAWRRLIIVPDGPLARLPFQALLTETPEAAGTAQRNYRQLPYVLRRFSIRYEGSGTLLAETPPPGPARSYLGFAPVYGDRDSVQYASRADSQFQHVYPDVVRGGFFGLTYNREEVANAARLAGGRFWAGEHATEANFKKQAPAAGILHLAMHAVVGFNCFSGTKYASAAFSFRGASDPPNTFRTPVISRNGDAPYYKIFSGTTNRWGDYSSTMVDPDDMGFWTLQEYAAFPSGGYDRWGTEWTKVPPECPDLYIQDTPADNGLEVNPAGGAYWVSDDIWVRNNPDNGLVHQNPEYRIGTSNPNYVYVKVHNRGGSASAGTEKLELYWAKAGAGLSWQSPWTGGVYYNSDPNMLMGLSLGAQTITSIPAGGAAILPFQWSPPDPQNYSTAFGLEKAHFCLLARITSSTSAPYGMTSPETGDLYGNVKNNNNIAWKNVTVVDLLPGVQKPEYFTVGNFLKQKQQVRIQFGAKEMQKSDFLQYGTLIVSVDESLMKKLRSKDALRGFEVMEKNMLRLINPGASFEGIQLEAGEYHTIGVHLAWNKQLRAERKKTYRLDVLAFNELNREKGAQLMGGETFLINLKKKRCWLWRIFSGKD